MSTPDSNAPQVPPVPAYGEYAPAVPPQLPYPYYTGQHDGRPPVRTADTIVSILLLFVGLFGALLGIFSATLLDSFMQGAYDSEHLGTYVPTAGLPIAQAVIIVSHLLLVILSTVLTIVLLTKRKVAFWVPLTAGGVATIVFWGTAMVLMMFDPAILETLGSTPN